MNDLAVEIGGDKAVTRYNHHLEDVSFITEHDGLFTTILFCDEY